MAIKFSLITRFSLLCLCVSHALRLSLALPLGAGDKDEIVLVEEVVRYTDFGTSSTATLITLDDIARPGINGLEQEVRQDNVDNESVMDTSAGASDDLIFLAAKKPTHLQQEQQQRQQQQKAHHRGSHEIDLLAVEDLLSSSSSSASLLCETHDGADGASVPHEIELRTDELSPATRPSIDMRDFVALIPAAEVKSIVANYYRNDPEVQRAYAYLSGHEFATLKQRIIDIPEMSAFLRYLNASGLDVVGFLYTLTNLTSKPGGSDTLQATDALGENLVNDNRGNEIVRTTQSAFALTTTVEAITTTTTTSTTTAAAAVESLNGLHGLVDSILDILPQDQILSTFFDKLESNEQFSKLVDNVGSPEFAKILHNMENSVSLRNLIFTLHNNGIYITRIVDSLKAYFFLGTF